MTQTVFISYSHNDKDQCIQLCKGLEKNGIVVHVDHASFEPGSNLRDEIRQHIEASDVTICLISANSLQSFWVTWEISGFVEKSNKGTFLPAYLDKKFLEVEFINEVMLQVRNRLKELEDGIVARLDNNSGSLSDLSSIRDNLNNMLIHLPKAVAHLRELCTIDLTRPNFENGFREIYTAITGEMMPPVGITLVDSLDNASSLTSIREIEDFIAMNKLEEAAKKTLDLFRGRKDQDSGWKAMRISGQIRQHAEAYERESKKRGQMTVEFLAWYNDERFNYADKLLDLIYANGFNVA